MKNYRIAVMSPGNAQLIEQDLREPGPKEVLVRNLYTVVSAGTERAWSTAMPNATPKFPWYPGYCGSGIVEKIGSEVSTVKVGDRVVVNWAGHSLYSYKQEGLNDLSRVVSNPGALYNIKQSGLVTIPEKVDMLDAAFTHIASFPFNGVRKLHLEIGESAMVIGQGILGVFALQIAALSGAVPMIVSDLSPARRELALKLGAEYALDPASPDYVKTVMDITEGEGVRGIVEVTGNGKALQQALDFVAWEGRVSLLGCTRISEPIDFYKQIHCRGVQLFGAHTMCRAKLESNPYHWTEQDDYRAFLKLLANGKMKAKEIISMVKSPKECHEVYDRLANDPTIPMGIVFDWQTL